MSGKDICLALLFVTFCAASLIVQKIALQEISVYLFNFLRLSMTFPLLIYLYRQRPKSWFPYIISGLIAWVSMGETLSRKDLISTGIIMLGVVISQGWLRPRRAWGRDIE